MANRANKSRGVALILVLWMLMLVTIMAGSFALSMRRELSIVNNARDLAEASALAEAGINYAVLMMKIADPELQWQANGHVYEFNFAGSLIRIKITDEAGKININNPDNLVLGSLLEQVGVPEDRRQSIIDQILDWQDEDDLLHLEGAEKEEYQQAGLQYGPSNKPFQTREELQLVLDVDAQLYEQLEKKITVYSSSNKINPAFAPKDVLLALPDVDTETIQSYIEARENATLTHDAVPEFPYPDYTSSSRAGVFTILAEARLSNANTGQIRTLISNKTSATGLPFTILEWQIAPLHEPSLFNHDD